MTPFVGLNGLVIPCQTLSMTLNGKPKDGFLSQRCLRTAISPYHLSLDV